MRLGFSQQLAALLEQRLVELILEKGPTADIATASPPSLAPATGGGGSSAVGCEGDGSAGAGEVVKLDFVKRTWLETRRILTETVYRVEADDAGGGGSGGDGDGCRSGGEAGGASGDGTARATDEAEVAKKMAGAAGDEAKEDEAASPRADKAKDGPWEGFLLGGRDLSRSARLLQYRMR